MDPQQNEALEVARAELMYRRDKQWHIFAWTTTLLVAAIGGFITLPGKVCTVPAKPNVLYSILQYGLMGLALIILAVYACLWINENMRLENIARKKVVDLLQVHGIDTVLPDPKKIPVGYVWVVALITIGALGSIVAPLLPHACQAVSDLAG